MGKKEEWGRERGRKKGREEGNKFRKDASVEKRVKEPKSEKVGGITKIKYNREGQILKVGVRKTKTKVKTER